MATIPPRAVIITRPTPLDELLAHYGTRSQARFVLEQRGQNWAALEDQHAVVRAGLDTVAGAVPLAWRRALIRRDDLDRFLFEPDDIILAVGQDGLVANVAKYLDGQPVLGINPAPDHFDGVLVRHAPAQAASLLLAAAARRAPLEARTMVEARTSDGQVLRALNELFIGHASHQSARYSLAAGEDWERQSSSGLIVTTGTGATGWARSICRNRHPEIALPTPTEPALAFFVREAFPSHVTGTTLTDGRIEGGAHLRVSSEMNAGGVVFGDGIESDAIAFRWGLELRVGPSATSLNLVAA